MDDAPALLENVLVMHELRLKRFTGVHSCPPRKDQHFPDKARLGKGRPAASRSLDTDAPSRESSPALGRYEDTPHRRSQRPIKALDKLEPFFQR